MPRMTADPLTPEQLAAVRPRLQVLYADLDARIAQESPRCELSGRCCRFKEYDHTLCITSAEAAILIADAPEPVRPLDDGETCPWQDQAGRCQAREARPIGCRVYFCDPAYEGKAPDITEEYLRRVRAIASELDLPWGYAPLHAHLAGKK